MMSPIGYLYLIRTFELNVCAMLSEAYSHDRANREIGRNHDASYVVYPERRLALENTWQGNLLFALKYEGVNLEVLRAFFHRVDEHAITSLVVEHPTGIYHRRAWFFYELLTDRRLPIDDLSAGNYVEAVDAELQLAISREKAPRVRRQRIVNNLIGDRTFCPLVRMTDAIREFPASRLKALSDNLMRAYPADLIYRAVQYLYVKETKASFAIERETPDRRRMEAFVSILKGEIVQPLTKDFLASVQNRVVDERYAQRDWRTSQVYVGETIAPGSEKIHFVAAKPNDVGELMQGLLNLIERLTTTAFDPVVAAAVVSFAFVFIHPFEDGNGRIHRYLMHYVLSRTGFVPKEFVFPVSAVLLKRSAEYDRMLETFSRRLMARLKFEMDERGEVMVFGESADFYRYIDFTPIVEGFQRIVRETIETEWKAELDYLVRYDLMRKAMREVVDMPEKKANQFIMFAHQNGGRLSAAKRKFFPELTDEEIGRMEECLKECKNEV